jgi:hypothetical protein
MARSRAPGIDRRQRLLVLRGQWLDCAFRRFASLYLPEANLKDWLRSLLGGAHNSDA